MIAKRKRLLREDNIFNDKKGILIPKTLRYFFQVFEDFFTWLLWKGQVIKLLLYFFRFSLVHIELTGKHSKNPTRTLFSWRSMFWSFWFGFPDETDETATRENWRTRPRGLSAQDRGPQTREGSSPQIRNTPVKGKEYVARSLDKSVNGLG